MRLAIAVYVLGSLVDLWTTWYRLRRGAREGNPILRFISGSKPGKILAASAILKGLFLVLLITHDGYGTLEGLYLMGGLFLIFAGHNWRAR